MDDVLSLVEKENEELSYCSSLVLIEALLLVL